MEVPVIVTKVEAAIEKGEKAVETFFQGKEAKILTYSSEAEKLTQWLKAFQGVPTVQQIETAVGVGSYATAAVTLVSDAANAIAKLDTQANLDAINGILLMLGTKLTQLFSSVNNIILEIEDAIYFFEKTFVLKN